MRFHVGDFLISESDLGVASSESVQLAEIIAPLSQVSLLSLLLSFRASGASTGYRVSRSDSTRTIIDSICNRKGGCVRERIDSPLLNVLGRSIQVVSDTACIANQPKISGEPARWPAAIPMGIKASIKGMKWS